MYTAQSVYVVFLVLSREPLMAHRFPHRLLEERQSFAAEKCVRAAGVIVVPHLRCVVIRNKMSHGNLPEDLTLTLSGGGRTSIDR